MGWGSGADLMTDVIHVVNRNEQHELKRIAIYKGLIRAFQGHDWDTEMDCIGIDNAFDKALKELEPAMFEDE